jgi:hypothetical protein
MKTADRGLTLVGIKLMGLALLCYAVVSFGQATITGVTFYIEYKIAQEKSPWQAPSDIREDLKKELTERSRMEDSVQRLTYQMQVYQSLSRLPWLLFVALVGLYMCRGGGIVLNFLTGKNNQKAQHPPTN